MIFNVIIVFVPVILIFCETFIPAKTFEIWDRRMCIILVSLIANLSGLILQVPLFIMLPIAITQIFLFFYPAREKRKHFFRKFYKKTMIKELKFLRK